MICYDHATFTEHYYMFNSFHNFDLPLQMKNWALFICQAQSSFLAAIARLLLFGILRFDLFFFSACQLEIEIHLTKYYNLIECRVTYICISYRNEI